MKDLFQSKPVPRGPRTMWRYLSALILLFTLGIGQMWADVSYYTPTADEVIILNDVHSSTATTAGYSSHAAVSWANTGSSMTASKYAGDPSKSTCSATGSKVTGYSVKGNGGKKDITINITGCSKIVVYHESQASRWVELRSGSKTGSLIAQSEASTYCTEVDLTGSTSYSIFLHGIDNKNADADFYVYAVKLIKATGGTTKYTVTAQTSTGTDSYGTVSAGASELAAGETTTITAVPAMGYKVSSWAVSGTGATIDPSGASNTTTLTMGTANATVTVYFTSATSYTVNRSLTHVTATSGANAVYEGNDYSAVFAADEGYVLPDAITVMAGSTNITAACTWNSTTGALTVPAASINGHLTITVAGVVPVAPATPDVVLNDNGTLNSTDFVTLVTSLDGTDYTVESTPFNNNFKFGNAASSFVNKSWSNCYLAYDVKTTSATLKVYVYNKNNATKNLLYQVLSETGNGTMQTEAITSKGSGKVIEIPVTATKGTRVVFGVSSSDVRICQIEVFETGTALPLAAQVGYEVALKGRPFATGSSNLFSGSIDGMEYVLYSELKLVNGNDYSVLRSNTGSHYFKFSAANDVQLQVTTTNASKFFVLGSATAGDENDRQYGGSADVHNINLPHKDGYWYIIPVVNATGTGNEVRISKIAFATLPAGLSVTYNANGGEGTLPTHADAYEGDKIVLASGDALEKSGYDFTGWKANGTGSLLEPGDKYTMTDAPVEFVAQWTVHVPKYGVKFMDGSEKLDSLSVTVGQAPSFANPTKPLFSFAGWKDGEDNVITLSDLATSVTVEDTKLVLYAQWTKVYGSSLDFAAVTTAGTTGSNPIATFLASGNMAATGLNESLWETQTGKSGYIGYKLKDAGAQIKFNLQAGKRAIITLGNVAAAVNINAGGAESVVAAAEGDNAQTVVPAISAPTEDILVTLTTTTKGTVTLKSIVIEDIPALDNDHTLKDLQVGGVTVAGFSAGTNTYYYEVPYGTEDFPVVSATANSTKALQVAIQQAVWAGEPYNCYRAQANVQAQDESWGYYDVRFYFAPKYGVELIKATHTGEHTATKAGYWKDDVTVDKTTQSGGKLGSADHYFGLTLGNEKTFKAGDMVVIKASNISSTVELFDTKTFASKEDSLSYLNKGNFDTHSKMYTFTLTADADKLYLYRTKTANSQMNPTVEYIAVYRYMAPFIEEFKIGDDYATITDKAIALELPHGTNLTGVAATVKAYANGGATVVAPAALAFNTPLVYTVKGAYAEDLTGDYAPVDYTLTLTEAPAIKEVVVSGTLTVKEDETTALSAVVYDTNDEEAANQNVTWSVKAGDESLASVDASGVVTGKAAGTAHIIATSVADGDIFAQVEVVVTENPCRAWSNPTTKEEERTVGKMKVTPTGIGTLQTSMVPYQGASACNAWKLDTKDSRYAEINFTDNAQFEGLTLGVSSKDSNKNYQFAVVCSSKSGANFADGILSAATYEAVDNDEPEALVDVELATGTKAVRVYRQVVVGTTTYGGGSSVFLYYINACKKELVPVTSVALADAKVAIDRSTTPVLTINPELADVASIVWSIVGEGDGTIATINATTGEVSGLAEGTVTVKAVVTDALASVYNATATVTVITEYEQVNVTGSITWNWANAGANVQKTDGNASGVLANEGLTNDASFNSQALWYQGSRPNYVNGVTKCAQVYKLKFHTTVAGVLTIKYSSNGSTKKAVKVGDFTGEYSENGGGSQGVNALTETFNIAANKDVLIEGVLANGNPAEVRIFMMDFNTNFDIANADYTRDVTAGRFGTICLENGGVMTGATLYEVAYYCQTSKKIFFDEILDGTMVAGVPYIYLPNDDAEQLGVFYTDAAGAAATTAKGLVGYIAATETAADALPVPIGSYILSGNQYRKVVYAQSAYILSHRAYINLDAINSSAPALAPGRRRISMSVQQTEVATDIDNVQGDDAQCTKVLINGQMYILRGEKMYDATGRLVK